MPSGGFASAPGRMQSLLLILSFGLLAGCAINPALQLSEITAEPVSLQATVPFYAQSEYQCGPAALAGVLGASGIDITPQALSPQVYLPERHGSLQIELLAATRRAGRLPYVLETEVQALIAEIHSGRPVLVLQNLLTRSVPGWHYAVLVGADPAANKLILNSGKNPGMTMNARKFLRTWDWAGRWAMVALKPGELPARGDPRHYAEAVAAFETVAGPEAATLAWNAALSRWPSDSRAYLGLGNLAYKRNDRITALDLFRRGLTLDPQAPALANNLASVLGELGCPRTGEQALQPVVAGLAGDSQWKPRLAATLEELKAMQGRDAARCSVYQSATPAPDLKTAPRVPSQ